MQTSRIRCVIAVSAVTAAASLSSPGRALAIPQFVGLGDLPGGRHQSGALGVSADGSVVVGWGLGEAGYEAFRWTPSDGMVGLVNLDDSLPLPIAMSADGSIVVGSRYSDPDPNDPYDGRFEAARWSASEGWLGLGNLPGGNFSRPWGVSADGSVVVGSDRILVDLGDPVDPNDDRREEMAFRWSTSDGMVSLGAPPGRSRSWARDVSADGSVVVGSSFSFAGGFQAFRWTSLEEMVGIGPVPSGSGRFNGSEAFAVSADGSAVVGSIDYDGSDPVGSVAFRWTASDGFVALGYLPGMFGRGTSATGVSPDGSVVVGNVLGQEPFLWTASDGMRSLRDIAVNDLGLDLSAWGWLWPTDVSADGSTIVGYGAGPNGQEAWMLVIPEPSSMLLLVAGVVPLLAFARRAAKR